MDARLQAANAILERGVRFRLPAPFYIRLLKKDIVTIRHLKAGTIIEFSRVVVENKLEEAVVMGDYERLSKTVEPCARCIAISILNDKRKIKRRLDKLTQKLLWKISDASLVDIFLNISRLSRVQDFMNITRFYLTQMEMMMNPKNLGQNDDGS